MREFRKFSCGWENGQKKEAKAKMTDVDAALGLLVKPEHAKEVQEKLDAMNSSRLGLKHPILTGIPTLGIWPAASRSNAGHEMATHLLRNYPEYGQKRDEIDDRAHKREVALMERDIADRKARAQEHMVGAATGTALAGLNSYLAAKKGKTDGSDGGQG